MLRSCIITKTITTYVVCVPCRSTEKRPNLLKEIMTDKNLSPDSCRFSYPSIARVEAVGVWGPGPSKVFMFHKQRRS